MDQKTIDTINRAKKGDQSAFTELYEAYYTYTFMATQNLLSSYEEREDVTQEAFAKVFKLITSGAEIKSIGSLLATTAKNNAKDHIKARNAEKRPDEVYLSEPEDSDDMDRNIEDITHSQIQKELDQLNAFYDSPEQSMEKQALSDILSDILSELPKEQQEALTMHYMEDMNYPEIAELYNVSVNTIKSRINQGKKKVETKVIEYEKKNKIKLHSFAPLPLFLYLLRQKALAEATIIPAASFSIGASGIGLKGIGAAIKRFFAKKVTIAGKTISTKVIVGVTATAVGVGGVVAISQPDNSDEIIMDQLEQGDYDSVYEKLHEIGIEDMEKYAKSHPRYIYVTILHQDEFQIGFDRDPNDGPLVTRTTGVYHDFLDDYVIFGANRPLDSEHDGSGYGYLLYKNETDPKFNLYISRRKGSD